MPNLQQKSDKAPSRWPSHRQWWVKTPDGVDISAREWGNPDGWPILFVHGLAQSHLSFLPQFASVLGRSHRLIAYDLRGHGESGKSLDRSFYDEGRRWADELAAGIDGVAATTPILVDRDRGNASRAEQGGGADAHHAWQGRRADPANRRGNDRSRNQGVADFLVRRLWPLPVRRTCRALQPRARRIRHGDKDTARHGM